MSLSLGAKPEFGGRLGGGGAPREIVPGAGGWPGGEAFAYIPAGP